MMVTVQFHFDTVEEATNFLNGFQEPVKAYVEKEARNLTEADLEAVAEQADKISKEPEAKEPDALKQAKDFAKAAKETHGEDFINEVMMLFPNDESKTLNQNLAAMTAEDLSDFIETVSAGPDTAESETVSPEEVKELLRALSHTPGKGQAGTRKLMKEHGVRGMSAVDEMSADALAEFNKALVEYKESE